MKFFYYYPTFNKPSGGNKQLRLMATLLRELGVETFLVRDRKFFAPDGGFDDNVFYSVEIPLAPFPFEEAGAHLSANDVLLLPEVLLESTLPLCREWKCRIALNNQNGFYALRYGPPRRLAGNLEFALANAPYVASISKDILGIPPERIFNVPHWIVRPPFDLRGEEGPRRLAVCYMPRKLPAEVQRVRDMVQRTHPDVPWVEIDGRPESDVAHIYRENSIFLAAQDLEGCPLTALEAMACGCLVAGYAGTARFSHPYATAENGLWVPDRDVEAAAAAIRQAIEVVRGDEERHRRYLAAGKQTALRFGRQAVREALAAMIPVVEKRSYKSHQHSVPNLGWRGTLFAYRLLYNYDRLGWPGRLVSWLSRATKPFRRNTA